MSNDEQEIGLKAIVGLGCGLELNGIALGGGLEGQHQQERENALNSHHLSWSGEPT
jgi:hypothetical protein